MKKLILLLTFALSIPLTVQAQDFGDEKAMEEMVAKMKESRTGFAEALKDDCAVYNGEYMFLFSPEPLKLEVLGKEGDKCLTIMDLPFGGSQECSISMEEVVKLADLELAYMAEEDGAEEAVGALYQKLLDDGSCVMPEGWSVN